MEPGIIWITVVILRLIHDTLTCRAGGNSGQVGDVQNPIAINKTTNECTFRPPTNGEGGFGFLIRAAPATGF